MGKGKPKHSKKRGASTLKRKPISKNNTQYETTEIDEEQE